MFYVLSLLSLHSNGGYLLLRMNILVCISSLVAYLWVFPHVFHFLLIMTLFIFKNWHFLYFFRFMKYSKCDISHMSHMYIAPVVPNLMGHKMIKGYKKEEKKNNINIPFKTCLLELSFLDFFLWNNFTYTE